MLLNWKEEITKIDPDIKFRLNGFPSWRLCKIWRLRS